MMSYPSTTVSYSEVSIFKFHISCCLFPLPDPPSDWFKPNQVLSISVQKDPATHSQIRTIVTRMAHRNSATSVKSDDYFDPVIEEAIAATPAQNAAAQIFRRSRTERTKM